MFPAKPCVQLFSNYIYFTKGTRKNHIWDICHPTSRIALSVRPSPNLPHHRYMHPSGLQICTSYIHASYIHASGSRIIYTCIMDTCVMDTCNMDTSIVDTCVQQSWIHTSWIHSSWIHAWHEGGKGGWSHNCVGHTACAPEGRKVRSQEVRRASN